MMAAAYASSFTSSPPSLPANHKLESPSSASLILANRFKGVVSYFRRSSPESQFSKLRASLVGDVRTRKGNKRPPPNISSGERLKLFYNPAATKLEPNKEFGIAFNGGFNQPIMCGGAPRAMLRKDRGKADGPIYTIQIFIPKHAVYLIFSFTNGVKGDGPYRLQFQIPKNLRNRPIGFFNDGLAEELSKEGACERAFFPDINMVITRCTMIGNLSIEGGDRCNLDLVIGCMDPSSSLYNPFANIDDGSCLPYSDLESED